MKNQIYFKQPNRPRILVKIVPHRWGPNGFAIVQSHDQRIYIPLVGNIADLIIALESAANDLRQMVCTEAERGILHGQADPGGVKPFSRADLIVIDDIVPSLPIAKKLALLIERFEQTLPDIAEALKRDYRAQLGREYQPGTVPAGEPSQLSLDLVAIRPIARELFKPDGTLKWGAQSRIAEALGVSNAGGYRERIMAVVKALTKEVHNSNTSKPDTEEGKLVERAESEAQVA